MRAAHPCYHACVASTPPLPCTREGESARGSCCRAPAPAAEPGSPVSGLAGCPARPAGRVQVHVESESVGAGCSSTPGRAAGTGSNAGPARHRKGFMASVRGSLLAPARCAGHTPAPTDSRRPVQQRRALARRPAALASGCPLA